MCGIAGIFRFKDQKVEAREIKSLTDCIAHRGPDAEGIWISRKGNIGLGHRRLSILDLSDNAAQPMHYANGRFTIVYNGEIFNFAELRQELISKGYQFHSDTDTEVLLAAYHAWGKDCLYRFNGFWAFAIWDEQTQELWLARDRFGIKPLYYLNQKDTQFVFGSETLLFKHIHGYERKADEEILCYNMQNCWGIEGLGKTIFQNINQVRPGCHLTVTPEGNVEEIQWWSTANHLVKVPGKYEDQVKQFKELFTDAVRIRLRSDVPLASALSGGLDSSSVFSMIYHLAKHEKDIYRLPDNWQRAFIAVFPGTEQDEKMYADEVLNFVNAKGTYVDSKKQGNLVQQIEENVQHFDCINASPELILNGLYGAMKQNGIKVSMDGHGVDEMMYGYAFNVLNAFGHYRKNLVLSKEIADVYENMTHPDDRNAFIKSRKLFTRTKNYIHTKSNRYLNFFSRGNIQWFNPEIKRPSGIQPPEIPEGFTGSEAQLYHDFHFTTLPTILRNFDRGSMTNGVEIRMPFLDYRIVTYVFSLPMQSKLGNGFTKRILRDAMKDMLPESIRTRRLKTGFNAPLKHWFQDELKEYILDEISSQRFLGNNLWNGNEIRNYVLTKTKNKNWTMQDTFRFWPVLNAHLLFKN